MRTVYKYIKPVLWPMIGGLTLKFIAAMFDLTIPYFLETIIDKAAPTGQINQVLFWGVVMLVCSVLALVTNVTANRMAVRNTSKVTKTLRHDLFAKISHLSARKTDEFTVSSLISRLISTKLKIDRTNIVIKTQPSNPDGLGDPGDRLGRWTRAMGSGDGEACDIASLDVRISARREGKPVERAPDARETP